MDANERLLLLEERLSRYKSELDELKNRQALTEGAMHEMQRTLGQQNVMLEAIYKAIEKMQRGSVEWVRWILPLIFTILFAALNWIKP